MKVKRINVSKEVQCSFFFTGLEEFWFCLEESLKLIKVNKCIKVKTVELPDE